MLNNFTGKTALVFGASRGIGLATAHKLAEYGATVILAARTLSAINKAADEIITNGGQAFAIACDVSDYRAVNRCVEFCYEKTQQLDIVVNNAGIIEPLAHLAESDPSIWGDAVDINFKGVYYSMRASIPQMLKSGGGVIVNMSSGAANSALVGWSHYCSTKSAVKKLTEVTHKEVIEHNIRVVGLSPGTVATDMMKKIKDSKINVVSDLDWSQHIPAEWAAEAVAFLCGPKGAEFAGTDFSIKTIEGRKKVGLPLNGAS